MHPVNYLLCYDIRDPRRLRRVHRVVRDWGMPVQYSVFEVTLTPTQRHQLLDALRELMDLNEDKISLYHLNPAEPPICLGVVQPQDDILYV